MKAKLSAEPEERKEDEVKREVKKGRRRKRVGEKEEEVKQEGKREDKEKHVDEKERENEQ